MFDARFFAYVTLAALLVLSPGATMAVVLQAAVERGRAAALATVVGVNIGNSTLAITSAVGMAAVFARWPGAFDVVKIAGAAYLAYLGARGLWGAWRRGTTRAGGSAAVATPSRGLPSGGTAEALRRGILTNLLNPSVIVFYMTLLPQFIGPRDPFLLRFLVLAATHVSMALIWLTMYAVTIGTFADRMSRPAVRRVMETVTGLVLVGFSLRLLLS